MASATFLLSGLACSNCGTVSSAVNQCYKSGLQVPTSSVNGTQFRKATLSIPPWSVPSALHRHDRRSPLCSSILGHRTGSSIFTGSIWKRFLGHTCHVWPNDDKVRTKNAHANAVLYEPGPREYSTRTVVERDFGSGHGALYDTPKRGSASPFGAHWRDGGVNFAVSSSGAQSCTLCLFTEDDLQRGQVATEVPLHPSVNRTGDVWHIFLPGLSPNLLYGYRIGGLFTPEDGQRFDATRIVVDPYAKAVVSRPAYGVPGYEGDCWPQAAGMVPNANDEFDWEGDAPPGHHLKDLVIYEMHVRGFTKHASSKTSAPGTYKALIEKLPHLKELGVNAIELLPIHEFNEMEYYSYNSVMGDYRLNFWGYSTINFFSPMTRYASNGSGGCGRNAVREFKTMVKECHRAGIEVILDVVFNHTAEGNEMGPTISFRGLDNRVYYMVAPKGEFYNYSGCGNTLNCNHPVVRQFIVDSLRYWVLEMHVDGFRFDLASILTRASSLWEMSTVYGSVEGAPDGDVVVAGTPLAQPPLVDMISNDPVLRNVKLIAEAWDAGGLYQVGSFPHWGVWAEWNGKFRDNVRQFIKGTEGVAGLFADCLCGSPNLYKDGGRRPWHSINFVTAHDGFTLMDLVSYNEKHNLANGENNNDGENHNLSWNCGEEGELVGLHVQRLRQRQIRNFIVALMVSQGVPMLYMGDEYGHTKGGNNNTYCHDSDMNYFRWDKHEADTSGFPRFLKLMTEYRKSREAFRLWDFPMQQKLEWHGLTPNSPDWTDSSKFVSFIIRDDLGEIYVAFNASHLPVWVQLPQRWGCLWEPVVDTSKPTPYDFISEDMPERATVLAQSDLYLRANLYPVLGYSSIILRQVLDKP